LKTSFWLTVKVALTYLDIEL